MSQLNNTANSGAKAAADYFANQAANVARTMPEIIDEGEARRLAANLVTKANNTLKEKNISWREIDTAKFTADLIRVVTLGLDAGADEVYIIPYGKKLDITESARGLRKLVINYPVGRRQVIDFRAYPIREGDHFTLKRTPGNDVWEFEEKLFSNGHVLGYVTIAIYEDNTSNVMVHSLEDIQKRRDASKSPNSPAWTKWSVEMAIAKATRRHCKDIGWALPKAKQDALTELEETEGRDHAIDVTPKINPQPDESAPLPRQDKQPETITLESEPDHTEEPNAVETILEPSSEYEPEQQEIDMSWAAL